MATADVMGSAGGELDLAALLDQPGPPGTGAAATTTQPTSPVPVRKQAVEKINYSHTAMIDLLIAQPGISQNALAAHFGYSPSWVSQVMVSDAFQAKLMERTAEIVDPTLRATVEERMKGVHARSLQLLMKRLESDDVPDNLILRSLDVTSRALGYGAREQTVAVQINVDNHLEALGGRLVGLLARKKAEAADPAIDRLVADL